MTVRVYRSTDFNAPILNYNPGKFIELLDGCLVNGYGDQTITITRVGIVGTIVTTSPHGLIQYGMYDISGANESDYNGSHAVTVIDANTLEYEVIGSPVSPATGTITGRLGGSGWTKPFSDTNKAAFKQATSNGYFRVDDTNNYVAHCTGYETMADIDNGTVPFPPDGTINYWSKAYNSTGTTIQWVIIADGNTFTYWANQYNNSLIYSTMHHFGDFLSYIPGDIYNRSIHGGYNNLYNHNTFYDFGGLASQSIGSYINRAWIKNDKSQLCGRVSDSWLGSEMGKGRMPYPTERDNALYTAKIYINDSTINGLIGEMKGLIHPLHAQPLSHFDIFDGIGDLAGRKFLVINSYNLAQSFFEISDTW